MILGGQVLPQGEDIAYVSHLGTPRDGVFYHFTLGRLASSAAAIDRRKKIAPCAKFLEIMAGKKG